MSDFWISEAQTPEAVSLYQEQADRPSGRTQAIVRVQGHHPKVATMHRELYKTLMFEPRGQGLSRQDREAIAVYVSALNECHY